MVHLNRIYTKSGDQGETSLGNGNRVPKTSTRIVAYGGTDELNSIIGLVLLNELPEIIQGILVNIQNDLFDLGADLCVPEEELNRELPPLRVHDSQVVALENAIDQLNEELEPLSSFVLPGGTPASASLHHARTVCRRVEISVLHLIETEEINHQVAIYLNRLSDYLFVAARYCNDRGRSDVLWVPGKNRK